MSPLAFGKVQLAFLLAPLAVVTAACAYWIGIGWINPGADISQRGHEELLYSALLAAAVELIAVPAAVVRMWRSAALRTAGNVAAAIAGSLPITVCAFLWLALLLGLG